MPITEVDARGDLVVLLGTAERRDGAFLACVNSNLLIAVSPVFRVTLGPDVSVSPLY